MNNKIRTLSGLEAEIVFRKQTAYPCHTVFTNGCFDVLHVGHIRLFEYAKYQFLEFCPTALVIVAVNDDETVMDLKGPDRPVFSLMDRMEMLCAISYVDFIIPFWDNKLLEVIKTIRPTGLLKGADWDKSKIIGADIVESYGGTVGTFPFQKGFSTTEIISKMRGAK